MNTCRYTSCGLTAERPYDFKHVCIYESAKWPKSAPGFGYHVSISHQEVPSFDSTSASALCCIIAEAKCLAKCPRCRYFASQDSRSLHVSSQDANAGHLTDCGIAVWDTLTLSEKNGSKCRLRPPRELYFLTF